MTLYERDLARIQAEGFGDFAARVAPAIVELLRSATVPMRRVYDVGCGAGVTTRVLCEAGFDVIAVEPSPYLAEYARAAAPTATIVLESAYGLRFERCDAVLAINEVLTYHRAEDDGDRRLQSFFENVGRVLSPGGKLVFDLIDADGPSLDARTWRTTDAWTILSETREDRATWSLARRVETFVREEDGRYRHSHEVHPVRCFREADVRSWLERQGFRVETARTYGSEPLLPRRVSYVATR